MGQGPRAQAKLIFVTLAVVWLAPGPALADPIVRLPDADKGVIRKQEDGPGIFALLAEVSGFGVLGAERLTSLPGYGSIEPSEPELALARVGVLGVHTELPIAGVVRIDASEAARVDLADFEDDAVATAGRFVDDAALWWRPGVWAHVIVGRQRVPFSRFRQLDETLLQAGAVPFSVARITPDRRWGAALHGDLGSLSYAAGAFEDLDFFEARTGEDDLSSGGRALFSFHTEWTPRAPIGRDHLATPTSDPWFDTVRVSAGLGALYRVRGGDRGRRLDLSASTQVAWRQLSGLVELLVSPDADAALAPAGQLGILVVDEVALYSRAEYDEATDQWSVGWGATFFATDDRRSKVGIYGWLRRELGPDSIRRDGVIVQLQAAL